MCPNNGFINVLLHQRLQKSPRLDKVEQNKIARGSCEAVILKMSRIKHRDFLEAYSDITEEQLDFVFDASRNATRKPFICTFTIKADELGLAAADVKEFSDISFTPHFSSEIHVLLGDSNTVCEKVGYKFSKRCKKTQHFKEAKVLSHLADVTALSYTNGNLLLSCSLDGTVKAWDRNYQLVQTFTDTMKSLSDVQASSKLEWFATSSLSGIRCENGDVLYGASLYSFSRKDPIMSLVRHTSVTQCVRFHANGMYVATASRDGTVFMWSTQASGKPVRMFRDGGPEETSAHRKAIAFSPDGKYLASTYSGAAKIWDIASGRLVQTLGSASSARSMSNVCFGDSGRRLATGGTDGQLRIWDINSAEATESSSECHFVGGPILKLRCTDDVYTCVC